MQPQKTLAVRRLVRSTIAVPQRGQSGVAAVWGTAAANAGAMRCSVAAGCAGAVGRVLVCTLCTRVSSVGPSIRVIGLSAAKRAASRVKPYGSDAHRVRVVVGEQADHLAHHAHRHLPAPPLLALHQGAPAVLAQDQVHAAIGPAKAGFGHVVALPAVGLADQLFELAPADRGQALEAGAAVEQAAAPACVDEGHQCAQRAGGEEDPGQRRQRGTRARQTLRERPVLPREERRHAVADAGKAGDADGQCHRPRQSDQVVEEPTTSASHANPPVPCDGR